MIFEFASEVFCLVRLMFAQFCLHKQFLVATHQEHRKQNAKHTTKNNQTTFMFIFQFHITSYRKNKSRIKVDM
jgi:hypothetical protein